MTKNYLPFEILHNNQQDALYGSAKTKEILLNATDYFLENSIINDIMQVQPLSKPFDKIDYLTLIRDDDKLSIGLVSDFLTAQNKEYKPVNIEALQHNVTSQESYDDLYKIFDSDLTSALIGDIIDNSTNIDKDKKIISYVDIISNAREIARKSRRSSGNVVVMSTESFLDLEKKSLMMGHTILSKKDDGYNYIAETIKVIIYDDIGDKILIGYSSTKNIGGRKGDGGAFFAPYRLFDNCQIVIDESLVAYFHVMSRYAVKYNNPEDFYITLNLI